MHRNSPSVGAHSGQREVVTAGPQRSRHVARSGIAVLGGAVLSSVAMIGSTMAGILPAGPADTRTSYPKLAAVSADDATRAAAVVAAEDRRITSIRTVSSLARWQGHNSKTPFRLATGTGYTLVLTPRPTPYGLTDLQALAPQTFVRMTDGAYLLSEYIVVMPKAVLRLSSPGGLAVRLASSPRGFATIVSLGGKLELLGEQNAPLVLTNWDVDAAAPDLQPYDGRAYVRAVGGQFIADHVNVSDLGFWSGRTGGIALTGTDRPNTGAIERVGKAGPVNAGTASVLDAITRQPAGRLLPGQSDPSLKFTLPAQDYVSSRISSTTIRGDAFGLFVSGANGLQVSNSSVSNSQIAGIVLHRFVSNGVLSRTTSSHNAGDGFSLDRATTGITISEATSDSNAGSGYRLSAGPSAAGSPTGSYGNNSVSNSTATDNGHYGVEVVGGFNIGVQNNVVSGNDMGIVVAGPAHRISVTGNQVSQATRHGISLVDGVTASTVTGNVVDRTATGIYLRASTSEIKGNTVQHARGHAVSLVGRVEGTAVSFNVLAGPAPVRWTPRGRGAASTVAITSSGAGTTSLRGTPGSTSCCSR